MYTASYDYEENWQYNCTNSNRQPNLKNSTYGELTVHDVQTINRHKQYRQNQ